MRLMFLSLLSAAVGWLIVGSACRSETADLPEQRSSSVGAQSNPSPSPTQVDEVYCSHCNDREFLVFRAIPREYKNCGIKEEDSNKLPHGDLIPNLHVELVRRREVVRCLEGIRFPNVHTFLLQEAEGFEFKGDHRTAVDLRLAALRILVRAAKESEGSPLYDSGTRLSSEAEIRQVHGDILRGVAKNHLSLTKEEQALMESLKIWQGK